MNEKVQVEVCIDKLETLAVVAELKPDRVELCGYDSLGEGGATCAVELVEAARAQLPSTTFVVALVRPRIGDFLYSTHEKKMLLQQCQELIEAGAQGIVTGALDQDGHVDAELMAAVVEMAATARAKNIEITFHRAIDHASDILTAVDVLHRLGVQRILTSGGAPNCSMGAGTIEKMVASGLCAIAAGGGLTSENVKNIVDKTGVSQVHGSFQGGSPQEIAAVMALF